MHKNMRAKTSSLVILLVTSFMLSAFAGSQFTATASAAGYTENVGTLDGVNYVVRFPDSWNGMLVVITQAGGPTPVLDARTSSYNTTSAGFLNKGYAVAASNYGGATGYCHTKAVNSTYTITKYIVDTYHITGKVFLYGSSMGGSFALFTGQKYPELYDGVLDQGGGKNASAHYAYYDTIANMTIPEIRSYINAPATFTDAILQSLKSAYTIFLTYYQNETGGTPQQVPREYEVRSSINYPNITIPVITIHASDDPLVPVSQTTNYQAAVAAAGRSALYRVYISTMANIAAQVPIRFDELVSWANAADGWTITVDGRGMKAYPDLKEYVWQKNASMAPNGPYDKIGLHRLVKTGITPKGVVFLCPGTTATGESMLSNPLTENFTKLETYGSAIYWANRGFEVYSIDYRKHFVPSTLNASQLSFMKDWGWDQWISDIKEAVEKAKEVSGASKVFMTGMSIGGTATLYYAAKYWQTDLRGIILMESSANTTKTLNPTNNYNFSQALSNTTITVAWASTTVTAQQAITAKYALENPGAPAEYPPGTPLTPTINPATNKTWANITEFFTYTFYNYSGLPLGYLLNLAGGYSNLTQYLYNVVNSDRYSPAKLGFESSAIADWTNCPYVAYDFDEHYKEINVPVLVFACGLSSNVSGRYQFMNGFATNDFTGIMLKNYGHYDVVYGAFNSRDVNQPALDWMLGHLSPLDVSAFQSVTVLPGWNWNFFVHNKGGVAPYLYQWYEGLNPIQGQTSMVLPVTKTSPGVYSFYCRVTDKDGTTTTSNAVTLTVLG